MPELQSDTVAFRFSRSQAGRLRAVGDAVQSAGLNPSLYYDAADSAERDDPLLVACSGKDDAEQIASLFVEAGFDRPAMDETNG